MDEHGLKELITHVKTGRLSRRGFVQMMVGLGLTAPMAAQMLASAGVAQAQSKLVYKPTKRGGGGALKTLWWQGATLLNPYFAVGTKDQDGSRIFYEPLASWDPDGNLSPVLAAESPDRPERRALQGRQDHRVEAQEGRAVARRQALHRRRRRLQLGVRGRSGHRRLLHRHLQGHQGREDRQPSASASPSPSPRRSGPTPSWACAA